YTRGPVTGGRHAGGQQELAARERAAQQVGAGDLGYLAAQRQRYPWLRLLRREVEDLVRARSGDRYLRERKARTELAQINRELKQLRVQLTALEERRVALLAELAEQADRPA